MDNFAERMLERTQRRQELLASASKETAKPILSKTVEMAKPTELVELPVSPNKSPPKTPPLQHQRRTRLAELASRIDQWLEEDKVLKPIEKNSTDEKHVSINQISKQVNAKKTFVSSVAPITSILKKTKSAENESSIIKSQPKSQTKGCRLQQLRQNQKSPEKSSPPQWESPNLAAATLTVAQRRALFEQNIATQKTNNKPTTTTIVTISMTKTTPVFSTAAATVSEEENNEPVSEMVVTTPPRPIPKSLTTPPSRRGTRPRMSPAIAAATNGTLSPQQRRVWTPPCIKNVLLKKQLNKELENDQQKTLTNNILGTVVTTSSPLENPIVSPADRIAMSVGHVRFKSPSPSGSLYPDLSLIEDNINTSDKETISTPIENQTTGNKRRNNYVLNSSTASSESVPEDNESNEIFAKRSKCEPSVNDGLCNLPTTQETSSMDTSLASPTIVASPALNDCNNSSVLSGITTDSPLSLKSTSFTYYPNTDNVSSTDNNLTKKYQSPFSEQKKFNTPCKQINEPQLIHSVSIYRQQQQQLRSSGTPTSKQSSRPGQGDTRSALLHGRMMLLEDDEQNDDDEDDEDYALQELEMAAARAWHLERTVVPEQDRIIDQATQALNICDLYRQRSGLRPEFSSKFSPEHVHAERLLLIAGLRRTDAVLEAQRLRVERTLLPDGVLGKRDRHPKTIGEGKTLVIESLRVPILSSVISSGSNKNKFSAIEGMENQTRWSGGYRYFVCAVRAVATAHRPPMTVATRPADALEESVRRFSIDAHYNDDGINYGYVEFITKKHVKNLGTKKCALPSASEGAPIMINGLNEDGWKVTIELYGLSPTATGDLENQNSYSGKDHHDIHENKSVLDKLWSTVKTPNKDSKKHHGILGTTCIESPSGPSAVRNTVFRQLGYFVFSDGQVDRQQFTLNKVYQSGGISNFTSRGTGDETVRVRMRLLEEGEQYAFVDDESPSGCTRKLLTLPPECKRMEGFLTLFDDHEIRTNPVINCEQQWHRSSNVGGGASGGTTLWRRLWFRIETVDDPQQQKTSGSNDEEQQNKTVRRLQTIVLRYWMYPEHAEQQRKPLGSIDLGHCISPKPIEQLTNASSEQNLAPAVSAPSELCTRPNTLRLLLYNSSVNYDDDYRNMKNGVDDPLLLSADTADERREWCDTVNAAVNAIGKHRKWFKLVEQQEKENEEQKRQQQNQQRTGAWPTTSFGSGKSLGKKKKLYK